MITQALADIAAQVKPEPGSGDSMAGRVRLILLEDNPVEWLEYTKRTLPRRWQDCLQDGTQEVELNLSVLVPANRLVGVWLGQLRRHLSEEFFEDTKGVPLMRAVSVTAALRAAEDLCGKMVAIEAAIQATLEQRAKALQAVGGNGNEIRRRRPRRRSRSGSSTHSQEHNDSHEGDDSSEQPSTDSNSPANPPSWIEFLATVLDRMPVVRAWLTRALSHAQDVSRAQNLLHKPSKLASPSQNTLVTLSMLVSLLCGIFMVLGVMQPRPSSPAVSQASNYDDNFFALLSQLPLQWLSLYATLVPLVRDKAAVLHKRAFGLIIAASALASLLAPCVYGVSW